jgi:anion-transporting  ArsA/GET3 family ATPase
MAEHRGVLDRRLLIVTGKGGVGKTTVAAGLAELAARQGKRVLLIAVDAADDAARCFEHEPVGFVPEEVVGDIWVMTMNTEDSLREYLRLNLKVPVLGRIGPVAQAFDFIATAAPGVKEILTTGKICWEVRQSIRGAAPWDLVIVDAAATGHVVAQLDAPRVLEDLVKVGPVRDQTRWMLELLDDPAVTALLVVTTAEEMPVQETQQLVRDVRATLNVELAGVVVNRVLPELLARADEPVFAGLQEPERIAILEEAAGSAAMAVLNAGRLATDLRRGRAEHLAELREAVDLPMMYVPELFLRSEGRRVTRRIADALADEL